MQGPNSEPAGFPSPVPTTPTSKHLDRPRQAAVEIGRVVLRRDPSCMSQPNPIFTACLYIPAANGLHTEAGSRPKSAGSSVQLGQGGNLVISPLHRAINEPQIKIITSRSDPGQRITSLPRKLNFDSCRSQSVFTHLVFFSQIYLERGPVPIHETGGVFSHSRRVLQCRSNTAEWSWRGCIMSRGVRGWWLCHSEPRAQSAPVFEAKALECSHTNPLLPPLF